MSKPVFEDLFSFAGRRNRKSYILFSLALFGWIIVMSMVIGALGAALGGNAGLAVGLLAAVLIIPTVIASLAVVGQRCRDFGWTGWAQLISLIPVVGFIFQVALFFVPGTPGPNRYGPDPVAPG